MRNFARKALKPIFELDKKIIKAKIDKKLKKKILSLIDKYYFFKEKNKKKA